MNNKFVKSVDIVLKRTFLFQFLDAKKVNNWYKDVKDLFDQETELANMHWIELSVPVRGGIKEYDYFY